MAVVDTQVITALQQNWVWVEDWDAISSTKDTVAGIVAFSREVTVKDTGADAPIHITADTRYKLCINGTRVCVGPARSVPSIWQYDTLDIGPFLKAGVNHINVDVIRYFPTARAGLPFVRSTTPGLTIIGQIGEDDISTGQEGWCAHIRSGIAFPHGLIDDVFLHINERVSTVPARKATLLYRPIHTRNGEQGPVRLRPRAIPLPVETALPPLSQRTPFSVDLEPLLRHGRPVVIDPDSTHVVDLRATSHSTAYLRWTFRSDTPARLRLKITYSEGYEKAPRDYPWLRSKDDRLDSQGQLLGPSDEVEFAFEAARPVLEYEPFWFRTFMVLRLEISVTGGPITFESFRGWQTNYPMEVKAMWEDEDDLQGQQLFDVSVRTMRNCMVDAYSDCPFYEQLQYAGDTRFVALFHYLLSGDDRLARQAITLFASSVTPEGLLQSRVPSHVQQIIAGFSLYWVLMVADHHLYFGDDRYTASFFPLIDGILGYFGSHVDDLGLVSGIEPEIWQYVDWVASWPASPVGLDKGVPPSGRESNRHTFFSILYAYALQQAADLLESVGRPGLVSEYRARAERIIKAIRRHCFDGKLYTDSTSDIADSGAYSWHCQSFAVLAGVAAGSEATELLKEALLRGERISKCSYAMKFYDFRALSVAHLYGSQFPTLFNPWRKMLADNMTTWAEDDVRQRSDCHAWSAAPIYEMLVEIAGVYPLAAGCRKIMFAPRVDLKRELRAKACLGPQLVAEIKWSRAGSLTTLSMELNGLVEVVSRLPGQNQVNHGLVRCVDLEYEP